MSLRKQIKRKIDYNNFEINTDDTGSTEVQIALLTEDIKLLNRTFQRHIQKILVLRRGLLK